LEVPSERRAAHEQRRDDKHDLHGPHFTPFPRAPRPIVTVSASVVTEW
jgi:hypothetical protein